MAGVERLRASRWPASDLILFAGLLVGYVLFALSAYELFGALSIGVTFFPPAGLTFAAFLLLPRRSWPLVAIAIVVGEVAVDMSKDQAFWWSMGWAAANLVEPLIGATITRRLITSVELTPRFARGFVAGGVIVGPVFGAAIGATVLDISNDFDWIDAWLDIWVGDALGVLVVAPCVIVLARPAAFRPSRPHTGESLVAASLVIVALAVGSLFFLTDNVPVGYLAIPLLGLTAVRYGPRELAIVSLVVASTLTAATARGRGPWATDDQMAAHTELVQQQMFLLAVIAGAWLLKLEVRARADAVKAAEAAAVERDRALERTKLLDQVAYERDHIAALQQLTEALAEATTSAEVVECVRRHGPAVTAYRTVRLDLAGLTSDESREGGERVLTLPVGSGIEASLVLDDERADGLDADDEARLVSAGLLVAQALERAALQEAQRLEHVRLSAMHEALSDLASAGTTQAVSSAAARQAAAVCGASVAVLAVSEAGEAELSTVWRSDPPDRPWDLVAAWQVSDEPLARDDPLMLAAQLGRPVFLAAADDDRPAESYGAGALPATLHRAALPLHIGGRRRAVLGLGRPRPWSDNAQVRAVALAAMVGDALARTEQAESDHRIALTLQKALMPGPVKAPGRLQAAGRYLPATESLEVGGDWYELITSPDDSATLIIGDVVGHSLAAAAAMGKLSAAARALAFAGHRPVDLVRILDLVSERTADAMMTTMVCATVDADARCLSYCCAGHPPPLLRRVDGTVTELDGGRGTPLAVSNGRGRAEATVDLEPGCVVVFYTDGLIDRRGSSFDERLDLLRMTLKAVDPTDAEHVCDVVVDAMLDRRRHADDVALLCLLVN